MQKTVHDFWKKYVLGTVLYSQKFHMLERHSFRITNNLKWRGSSCLKKMRLKSHEFSPKCSGNFCFRYIFIRQYDFIFHSLLLWMFQQSQKINILTVLCVCVLGVISGRVWNDANALPANFALSWPMAGISLDLYSWEDPVETYLRTTTSDAFGLFTFNNLEQGIYHVLANGGQDLNLYEQGRGRCVAKNACFQDFSTFFYCRAVLYCNHSLWPKFIWNLSRLYFWICPFRDGIRRDDLIFLRNFDGFSVI